MHHIERVPIWERPNEQFNKIMSLIQEHIRDSNVLYKLERMIEDYGFRVADYQEWSSDPDC